MGSKNIQYRLMTSMSLHLSVFILPFFYAEVKSCCLHSCAFAYMAYDVSHVFSASAALAHVLDQTHICHLWFLLQ